MADPSTAPEGSIRLTVAPAPNPPSAGVTVIVRLAIGGGVMTASSPPPPHANSPTPAETTRKILKNQVANVFTMIFLKVVPYCTRLYRELPIL